MGRSEGGEERERGSLGDREALGGSHTRVPEHTHRSGT